MVGWLVRRELEDDVLAREVLVNLGECVDSVSGRLALLAPATSGLSSSLGRA